MGFGFGVVFAIGALFFWGIGDFLIQKTTRRIGDWETILFIVAFGTVILTPFVYSDLIGYLSYPQALLTMLSVSVIIFVAALIDFEALKRGKIAAVEPALSLEIPTVAIMSILIINETLQPLELIFLVLLMIGLVLISLKSRHLLRKAWLERGMALALIAAVLLGIADFLVGFAARATSPLLINWFINITLTAYTLVYVSFRTGLRKVARNVRKMPGLLLATCTFDNFAWISYAFATVLMPITIAVAISENYIALAAILGLLVNKERLVAHQKLGLVIALSSAVVLSLMV